MSESDPGCVKTSVSRGCRELFSHFRLLAEVASAIEFPHLRNLERCSTRKLNDGVFTQPVPTAEVNNPSKTSNPRCIQPSATPERSTGEAVTEHWQTALRLRA